MIVRRIVHEDVEPAEQLHRSLDSPFDRIGIAQVRGTRLDPALRGP
jgi:hypothetical protein